MRKIDKIYVHCSASMIGTVESIRQFHITSPPNGRGWKDIGYHYVITNPYKTFEDLVEDSPDVDYDGRIFQGRPIEVPGAHVGKFRTAPGDNATSIGICLVGGLVGDLGKYDLEFKYGKIPLAMEWNPFTTKQLDSLFWLLDKLLNGLCPIISLSGLKILSDGAVSGGLNYKTVDMKLKVSDVYGHNESASGKAQGKKCPEIDMNWIREELVKRIDKVKVIV